MRVMKIEIVGLGEPRLSQNGKITRPFSGWALTNEGELWATGWLTAPTAKKQSKTAEQFSKLFES